MSRLRRRILVRSDGGCVPLPSIVVVVVDVIIVRAFCHIELPLKKKEIFEERIEKKAMPLLRGRRKERERERKVVEKKCHSGTHATTLRKFRVGCLVFIRCENESALLPHSFDVQRRRFFSRPKRTIEIGNRYYRDHSIVV